MTLVNEAVVVMTAPSLSDNVPPTPANPCSALFEAGVAESDMTALAPVSVRELSAVIAAIWPLTNSMRASPDREMSPARFAPLPKLAVPVVTSSSISPDAVAPPVMLMDPPALSTPPALLWSAVALSVPAAVIAPLPRLISSKLAFVSAPPIVRNEPPPPPVSTSIEPSLVMPSVVNSAW